MFATICFAAQGCGRAGLLAAAGVVIFLSLLYTATDARGGPAGRLAKLAVLAAGIALTAALAAVGMAQAQQPYGYRPAARTLHVTPARSYGYTYGYRPAARASYAPAYSHGHVRDIVIVEAADAIFDLTAKDIFVFTAPPAPAQGFYLGVRGNGAEARYLAPLAPPARVPAGTPGLTQAPEQQPAPPQQAQQAPQVTPAEQEAQPAPQKAVPLALASLSTSCASCHTQGGKVRGDFVLFSGDGQLAGGIDWKRVLARIDSADDPMPPASSGLPKVSAQDRADIAKLAK